MNIIIDSKASLHAFATCVSLQTNMPVPLLKTAIGKSFAFANIAEFEAALESNKAPGQVTDVQTIAPEDHTLQDDVVQLSRVFSIEAASDDDVLEWAGADSVSELNNDLYERSEDAILSAAKNMITDPKIHALAAMLEGAGMSDMLDKIKSLAYSIQINEGVSRLV